MTFQYKPGVIHGLQYLYLKITYDEVITVLHTDALNYLNSLIKLETIDIEKHTYTQLLFGSEIIALHPITIAKLFTLNEPFEDE